MVCIYTLEYYSVIKKKRNLAICNHTGVVVFREFLSVFGILVILVCE